MANRSSDAASEGVGEFKSGHAMMAYVYETEGEEAFRKCLETWDFPRDRCELYAQEYRKRRLTKLAEIMDEFAANTPYSWDDPADCPGYYYGDHAGWAWDQLRHHMMRVFTGDPQGYQAWLKSQKRS
jgi:hypothetical protein